MKEKPIIFNTEMVRAILDGRKSQTRRVVKERVSTGGTGKPHSPMVQHGGLWLPNEWSPYGQPGDLLWVRETWKPMHHPRTMESYIRYKADGFKTIKHNLKMDIPTRWKPSIHMPKAAARLWLRVKDVRVERVQDISFSDMLDEGIDDHCFGWDGISDGQAAELCEKVMKQRWIDLWNSINEKRGYGWDVNPWVWVVSFERVEHSKERDNAA
jgi:hypothetical protein